MYEKILVAIDRSEISNYVFQSALSLAKTTGASLMLLHVLSSEEEGSPVMSLYPSVYNHYIHLSPIVAEDAYQLYSKQWETFEQKGIELLRSLNNEATTAGVRAEFSQISGNPGRTICELAQNWEADLIVIGSRGFSGLKELFLGSVSNYVVHHASRSVLVVHTPAYSLPENLKSKQDHICH